VSKLFLLVLEQYNVLKEDVRAMFPNLARMEQAEERFRVNG
jgi:hypothetical protein